MALEKNPLYVDLDGTLVATDTLWESLLCFVKKRPLLCWFIIPYWLYHGRVYLKSQLANNITLDVSTLPYRDDVLEFINNEKQKNRNVFLCTAAHENIATAVANHLGIFDGIIASNANNNAKGSRKLELLQEHCPQKNFSYIGDSKADIPLWQAASDSLIVVPSRQLPNWASTLTFTKTFNGSRSIYYHYFKALRPHQWAKNFLIFLPLLLSHKFFELNLFLLSCATFAAMSFCASSIYIVNDLLDIQSDRQHPTKQKRPFASGAVPIPHGFVLMAISSIIAWGIAFSISLDFCLVLACYVVLTTLYSFILKSRLMVDVIMLACLYVIRLFAGSTVTEIPLSPWLFTFSLFIFLSLAFAKRYTELQSIQTENKDKKKLKGRNYVTFDMSAISELGTSSGLIAVLVLGLYIFESEEITQQYAHPDFLWLLCPLFAYWISRFWIIVKRGQMHHDPVVFALRDKISYYVAAIVLIIVIFASSTIPLL